MATLAPDLRTDSDVRTLWFGESLAEIRVSTRDGEGAVSVIEMDVPEGHMPPLHVHDEDETFHVLDGSATFYAGDAVIEARAGDTILAPQDVPHAYRAGPEGARWLVITSPGRFENFVRAMSRPAESASLPPAVAPTEELIRSLSETAAANGIDILGPPGMLPTEI